MSDYRNSVEFSSYYCSKGWSLDSLGDTNILFKQLPLIGNVIRIQRGPLSTTIADLDEYAKSKNVIAAAIEPDITTDHHKFISFEAELASNGYTDLNLFLSPTKTTHIDLRKTETDLLASFDHDIRKTISNNQQIEFKYVSTFDEIYTLLKSAGTTGQYYVQTYKNWLLQWKDFGADLRMVLAYKNGELLGGNMYLINYPTAFGLFLPSTEVGKNLKVSASLIWKAIQNAKNEGCITFDLNGLYDERYNSPKAWKGLSQFKKKFNGHEIMYMHPKVKVFSGLLKPLKKSKMLWIFFTTL
jgi:lipid II:glycine glycyltransferase (peptidoglycan interpeptide bridge formation enzyme)